MSLSSKETRWGLLVMLLVGGIAWLVFAKKPRGNLAREAQRVSEASVKRSASSRTPLQSPKLPATEALLHDGKGADTLQRRTNIRLTVGIFNERYCSFGVRANCSEWHEKSKRCDAGEIAMCKSLGNLLIQESPMAPLLGSIALQSACELGDDESCARALKWRDRARYGLTGHLTKEGPVPMPDGLDEACEGRDLVACGLIEMHKAGAGQPGNAGLAMEACKAGFRDVCGAMSEVATDDKEAIRYLEAGCDIPDGAMCQYLAERYAPTCVEEDGFDCFAPNLERYEYYHGLACELVPTMHQCGNAAR